MFNLTYHHDGLFREVIAAVNVSDSVQTWKSGQTDIVEPVEVQPNETLYLAVAEFPTPIHQIPLPLSDQQGRQIVIPIISTVRTYIPINNVSSSQEALAEYDNTLANLNNQISQARQEESRKPDLVTASEGDLDKINQILSE